MQSWVSLGQGRVSGPHASQEEWNLQVPSCHASHSTIPTAGPFDPKPQEAPAGTLVSGKS